MENPKVRRKLPSGEIEEVNFSEIKAGDFYAMLDLDDWNVAQCDAFRLPDQPGQLGGWTAQRI